MPTAVLRGVIDDDHLADLELRNRARAAEVIAQLGSRYCCHPNYKSAPLRCQTEEA
jgi:hypothetical protein